MIERMHTLLQTLADKGQTLGCVESLSGGKFAAEACCFPGASHVFKGGLVTYTPETKIALAHVKKITIDRFGIVSPSVASEMAIGGKKALGVDMCLSCTGNAGPTAQEGGAAVGDVCFALAYGGSVWTIQMSYGDIGREEIRNKTMKMMVELGLSVFESTNIKLI